MISLASKIIVENPGLLTTVQDLGRYGYQQYGMPVAGAMDNYALKVGNILVGNDIDEAGLEITLTGCTLKFNGKGIAALTGADLGAHLNGKVINNWQSFEFNDGDRLVFTTVKKGCRAYLTICGGIDVPVVMGSKSTYLRGKIGGFQGRKLMKTDVLACGEVKPNQLPYCAVVPDKLIPDYDKRIIRVVLGPQDDYFLQEEIEKFLVSFYEVTGQYDRMGYRLKGQVIKHKKGPDIVSDGIAPGAIQIPGHGQPIIMLVDRQTTGGYTKIANVISVDLPLLAQIKPGEKVNFTNISIQEAQELYQEQEKKLVRLKALVEQNRGYTDYFIRVNGKRYSVRVEEIM